MKFLVKYEKIADTTGKVSMIVQNPIYEDPTENSFYTDSLTYPVQESIPNMEAYLRVNLETKELYYDYILRETFETKVTALQQENNELKQAIADLTATLAAVLAG